MESGREVSSAIRSLVNDRSLQLRYTRVLHEALLLPIILYDSETMI